MNRCQKVLVVDDNEAFVKLLAVRLKDLSVELIAARGGLTGLYTAQQELPDLILLDVAMPDMDGYEVCRRLKKEPRTRAIPVIFLSGRCEDEDKVRGFEAGGTDYVIKPFNAAELRARVSSALKTKALVEMLEFQARTDSLTDLANREWFCSSLARCVRRARTFGDYMFAILFLDLDHFKVINDSLGHAAGDQLLVTVAKRLQRCVRRIGRASSRSEGDLVGRMGGDEFAILLDEIHDPEDAHQVAERVREELAKPYILGGMEVSVAVSVGIRLGDAECPGADELLRDSDTAMYCAKAAGRSRYTVFDQAMHDAAMRRLQLEHDLRKALDANELALHYQPIISLETGGLIAFEALLRWQHPELGPVSPMDFIPIAEETGLIVPIGLWVVEQACRQLRRWQDRFPSRSGMTMNVNLSKRQITQADLCDTIAATTKACDIDPRHLSLEVTENVIMQSVDQVVPILEQLKTLGLELAMDDFGTGHSSLSCLHRFPIDVLKIDRSFIRNMGMNVEFAAITQAVVTLAHNLDMRVVAEGIEQPEQLAQLQALECDYAQGFLIARPAPPEEVEALLSSDAPLAKTA